jgi:Asp-tRNA(Asn)/Glu-tRNA(Gln) amidotransferase A subunit family amidase
LDLASSNASFCHNANMTTATTSTSDLCYATATDLARRIRDREISSAEVTEAFLTRIASHNGKLNAIVHHDVLLAPVSFGPAFKRCKEGSALDFDGAMRPYNDYCWPYVAPFNASGHPALVMPLGTSKDGLPLGVQLIGPYWSEPELLRIARKLAPLTKGFVAPQGF